MFEASNGGKTLPKGRSPSFMIVGVEEESRKRNSLVTALQKTKRRWPDRTGGGGGGGWGGGRTLEKMGVSGRLERSLSVGVIGE